jgi:hypothetical protein
MNDCYCTYRKTGSTTENLAEADIQTDQTDPNRDFSKRPTITTVASRVDGWTGSVMPHLITPVALAGQP